MYGRKYWGALRAMFVVGPDGVVAHVIPRCAGQARSAHEVSAVLEQMAAA